MLWRRIALGGLTLVMVLAVGCAGGDDDDDSVTPTPTPTPVMRFFTTRARYNGDLATAGGAGNGLQGADNICGNAANAAALGGTWIALISASGSNAVDRGQGGGPWFFVDGLTLVFNNKANLTTTPVQAPNIDEFGAQADSYVWTGSQLGAVSGVDTCADWTTPDDTSSALTGINWATNNEWIEGRGGGEVWGCSGPGGQALQLYCIEQ